MNTVMNESAEGACPPPPPSRDSCRSLYHCYRYARENIPDLFLPIFINYLERI